MTGRDEGRCDVYRGWMKAREEIMNQKAGLNFLLGNILVFELMNMLTELLSSLVQGQYQTPTN